MDTDATLATRFAAQVKTRLTGNKRVRITGHWYWHTFNAVRDFGLPRTSDVEYINILRQCSHRFKSQLLFELFDTKEAKAALANQRLAAHQNAVLNSSETTTVRECIENFSCLNNVFKRRILQDRDKYLTGMMVEYLSGTNKMRQEGNSYSRGAEKHLNRASSDDDGYSVLGFLEHYKESLELLECAYPTFFQNAGQIYKKQRTHFHQSSVLHDAVLYNHSNFELVLKPLCDIADNRLYSEALEQFWSKLALVRMNRSDCCRSLASSVL